MGKQLEWAKDYIRRVDLHLGNSIGGLELELYNLAKAIVSDAPKPKGTSL